MGRRKTKGIVSLVEGQSTDLLIVTLVFLAVLACCLFANFFGPGQKSEVSCQRQKPRVAGSSSKLQNKDRANCLSA